MLIFLTHASILILPKLGKPFEVVNDASLIKEKQICFKEEDLLYLKVGKFLLSHMNYSTREQEFATFMQAM